MMSYFDQKPKTLIVLFLVIGAFIFSFYASNVLNKSYEASQFPVVYFEAQLSFSAEKIKSWYEFLI